MPRYYSSCPPHVVPCPPGNSLIGATRGLEGVKHNDELTMIPDAVYARSPDFFDRAVRETHLRARTAADFEAQTAKQAAEGEAAFEEQKRRRAAAANPPPDPTPDPDPVDVFNDPST